MAKQADLPWPTPVKLPAAFRRNANHFRGLSTKSNPPGRKVDLYGTLEYHNWLLEEANPDVVGFCEQPLKIEDRIKGRKVVYVMDSWLRKRGGHEVYREVKESDQLVERPDGSKVPRKWEMAEAFAAKHHRAIDYVTEKELHANPTLLHNALRCVGHAWTSFRRHDENLRERIAVLVADQESMPIGRLLEILKGKEPEAVFAGAVYLVVHGELQADLSLAPLAISTVIRHGHTSNA